MDDPNFLKASLRAHRDDKLHEKFGVVQTEKGPNWLRDYLEVESECKSLPEKSISKTVTTRFLSVIARRIQSALLTVARFMKRFMKRKAD
jgi:hypothetical protein